MKTFASKKINVTKERDERDNFELPSEINFTGGIRGRFYRPKKVSTTIRLDDDILIFFRRLASEKKSAYQTLMNDVLREYKSRTEGHCSKAV